MLWFDLNKLPFFRFQYVLNRRALASTHWHSRMSSCLEMKTCAGSIFCSHRERGQKTLQTIDVLSFFQCWLCVRHMYSAQQHLLLLIFYLQPLLRLTVLTRLVWELHAGVIRKNSRKQLLGWCKAEIQVISRGNRSKMLVIANLLATVAVL